ncbi:MAG: PilZ domain-containing protein [Myxococcota bacterium]|nr:PilZ domain-containing protein [Myxococcota bacterium]
MHDHRPATHRIASHLGPGAMTPGSEQTLGRLGYTVEAWTKSSLQDAPGGKHRLHLVDDRNMESIPTPEADPDTPIILLTGARPKTNTDPRIAGQLMRPVAAHDLYLLLEHALEMEPRKSPRVRTRLSARYLRRHGSTQGRIESLSTSGCRLTTSSPLKAGRTETLQIAIPTHGLIQTRARCVWARDCVAGFEFVSLDPVSQQAVARYVDHQLARGLDENRRNRAA